jgi:integrase
MPRPRKSVPSYRLHKQSGQAVVTLPDGLGRRRDVLLGPHGTPESRQEYLRVLAEWEANGRGPPPRGAEGSASDLTVNELALAYWKHAEAYYRFDGRKGTESNLRDALRILKELYGHTVAADFGPLALKACRAEMVKKGWARTYVNAQVDRVRRMFRWAAEEEMLPVTVYQALRAVESLRRGRTEARETPKVRPVPPERVDATLPFLPPVVRAMVGFQRLTGCRPDEVCRVRPLDLDLNNPACWVYRPGSDQGPEGDHKTAHHGHERLILVGPRAQEVLRPYLGTKLESYCFSPAESERRRSEARREARQTPLTPSQRARRPKAERKRAPRDRYDETSYRNAVYRACDRAFPLPEHLAPRQLENGKREAKGAWWERLTPEEKVEARAWRRANRWHPNRLRHAAATAIRGRYGVEAAKVILGHTKVETTQIYAERDLGRAQQIMAEIG